MINSIYPASPVPLDMYTINTATVTSSTTVEDSSRWSSFPLPATPLGCVNASRWIAVINSHSGGGKSKKCVEAFESIFGRSNVLDVDNRGEDLNNFLLPENSAGTVVLIIGGDGTASLVMDVIDSFDWSGWFRPMYAIFPLGTGNDLSRELGWGGGYRLSRCTCVTGATIEDDIRGVVNEYRTCSTVSLADRWRIDFLPDERTADGPSPLQPSTPATQGASTPQQQLEDRVELDHTPYSQPKHMNNYLSVGVDGRVVHEFQEFRRRHPKLCRGRKTNRWWYFQYCVRAAFTGEDITKKCTVLVDGYPVDLPKGTQAVLVSNLNSYAGGMRVWRPQSHRYGEHQINDLKLEVVAFFGTYHSFCCRYNVRRPVAIAQGGNVAVICHEPLPYQLDGEAVMPTCKSHVRITPFCQIQVLRRIGS